MNSQKGSRSIELLLNLGARELWVVNAMPRQLYRKKWPSTHCTGGWVSPRTGLDGFEKISPSPGFDPRIVQSTVNLLPTELEKPIVNTVQSSQNLRDFFINLFPPSSEQKKKGPTWWRKQQTSHTNDRCNGKGTVGFVSFMSVLTWNSRKKKTTVRSLSKGDKTWT
jgi:hypothetical protein